MCKYISRERPSIAASVCARAWRAYSTSWELWHLYTMESRSEEDITMVRLYLEELGELLGISAPAVLDLHEFCTSDDADVWELAMVTIERMDDPLGYV